MKTYEDLLEQKSEAQKKGFLLTAINEHKATPLYQEAVIANEYMKKRNVTIMNFVKWLYKITGEKVKDIWSANYKLRNSFYPIFINQEVSHLLGNGVQFEDDATKEALGGEQLDNKLVKLAKKALNGGVAFGFFNVDHIDIFDVTEFVPLIGEEDGGLHAGIRFWQIDSTKPLRVTLYEEDGYTEYIKRPDEDMTILKPKRMYKLTVAELEHEEKGQIIDGENYPTFPIVPLWGNEEHQSELIGLRERIDCYDLIQSGFANDLDDASYIYWTITNSGGMDEVDLAKFVERMKTVRASYVDEDGSSAEAHTMDVPYSARQTALEDIRNSLYRDAMALDTDKISAGQVTATAIQAAYENLSMKCDNFEMCINDFLKAIMEVAGLEDNPVFKRSKIVNMMEETQTLMMAAQYLDDETIVKHLPFLSPDEVDDVLERRTQEESERYEDEEAPAETGEPMDESEDTGAEADTSDIEETGEFTNSLFDDLEEAINKMLNDLLKD